MESYSRGISKIERYDLLILDNFGLENMDCVARMCLLETIEGLHERKSALISSQLPVAKWYKIIGESTIADAILDWMGPHFTSDIVQTDLKKDQILLGFLHFLC